MYKHSIVSVNLLWFWYASEQYVNESEERCSQIESAIKSYSDDMGENLDREYFLSASNFLVIRNYLTAEINDGIPLKSVRWKIALSKTLLEWNEKLSIAISKY